MTPLLVDVDLERPWWLFATVRGRDAVAAYYRRRGWYVVTFVDKRGPALHAAREHFTAPPGSPHRRRLLGVGF